jgi:hypothetical protein
VSVSHPLDAGITEALVLIPDIEVLSLESSKIPSGSRHQPAEAISLPEGALSKILSNQDLKYLYIEGFLLSSEDYQAVAAHHSLQVLSICGTNVDEHDLVGLVTLPRLVGLILENDSRLTGSALHSTAGSTTLRTIRCDGTPLGSDFAAYVARCPNVRMLDVGHGSVNDALVSELAGHAELAVLDLVDCNISDASVPAVQTLPVLESIVLPQDKLSPRAILQIRSARPRVGIVER